MAHPTTDVFYGKITFPATETDRVLQGWADYLRSAPDELTSVVTLANPAAGGPEAPIEVHVVFDGHIPERAAEALEPIRRLGTVIDDDVALTPYADTLADGATPPTGIRFVTRSAFVEKDSVPEVLHILAESAASNGSPAIGIRSVSGAASRVPDDATAYPHRRAELMVVTLTAGPESAVKAAEPKLDAIWADLGPHVAGAYANFLTSATAADVAAIYPAKTFQRLAAVKRHYDPGNLFARNHNIPPSSYRSDGAHHSRTVKGKTHSSAPHAAPRCERILSHEHPSTPAISSDACTRRAGPPRSRLLQRLSSSRSRSRKEHHPMQTTQRIKTMQPTTPPRSSAIAAMAAGLALTIVATIVPFITSTLRDHIRAGYPDYTAARVDTAVNIWLIILTIIGALGAVGWLGSIWIVATTQALGELGGDRGAASSRGLGVVVGAVAGPVRRDEGRRGEATEGARA